ncbi:MAG: SDR family NAD(P)-dependent oxidoreductase [Phreatobacter sp.]|nr:SDR family NAD(P)-dependent oxidoreductase [Phreatobacter sp.]
MKKVWVVLHDFGVTFAALMLALLLRGEPPVRSIGGIDPVLAGLGFAAFALLVYGACSLYASRWRFASLFDLFGIFKAVCILTALLLIADYLVSPRFTDDAKVLGGRTLVIYWCVQVILLGGPRIAYRAYRSWRRQTAQNRDPLAALVIGRASDADSVIRAVEAGVAGPIRVFGIVSPIIQEAGQAVRGVPVWGTTDQIETIVRDAAERGITIQRAIIAPEALHATPLMEAVIGAFRRVGIPTIRLDVAQSVGFAQPARLHAVIDDDLLIRPLVEVDEAPLKGFVRGKRVVVTGGGGSIGSELALRSAQFGAEAVLVLDSSEAALHAVLDRAALEKRAGDGPVEGRLCDIRDRSRLMTLLSEFAPDVVFHAAALKHVPHLEREVSDAVRTNVLGTVNTADAAIAAGASAFVLISTDKATEPVSILGATKRLAEMYVQALDAAPHVVDGTPRKRTRLVAVRFGNVLGTAGSVVPRFRAQIEAGGPVTVTDPAMVRYFMTKREATDLLWTAARITAETTSTSHSAILVLNMGQPVRIDDLARRMIRLAGFEPGKGIDIVYSGRRPGERLSEILFEEREPQFDIGIRGIVAAEAQAPALARLQPVFARLQAAALAGDDAGSREIVAELVPRIAVPARIVRLRTASSSATEN